MKMLLPLSLKSPRLLACRHNLFNTKVKIALLGFAMEGFYFKFNFDL